jgi:hypothetical protein
VRSPFKRRSSRADLMTIIASLHDERDHAMDAHREVIIRCAELRVERDASRDVAERLEAQLLTERDEHAECIYERSRMAASKKGYLDEALALNAELKADHTCLGTQLMTERAEHVEEIRELVERLGQEMSARLDAESNLKENEAVARVHLQDAYQSRDLLALALADINAAVDGAAVVPQVGKNASRSSVDTMAIVTIRAVLGRVAAHLDEPLDEPEPEPTPAVWVPQPGEVVTVVRSYVGRVTDSPTYRDGQLAEYVESRESTDYPHRVRWVIDPGDNGSLDEDSDIVHEVAQYTAPAVAP